MQFNPESEDPQPFKPYPHTEADEVADFIVASHDDKEWHQYAHPDAPPAKIYTRYPVVSNAGRAVVDAQTAAQQTQG